MVAPRPSGQGLTYRPGAPSQGGLRYRPPGLSPLQSTLAGGMSGLGRYLMALGAGQPQQAGAAFSSGLQDMGAKQRQAQADYRDNLLFDLGMEDRQTASVEKKEAKEAAAREKATYEDAIRNMGLPPDQESFLIAQGPGGAKFGDLFPEPDTDAPTVKDFVEGGQTVQKQWDSKTKSWVEIGRGDRWKPEGEGIQIDTNGDGIPDVTIGGKGMKLTEGQSIGTMQYSLADQANKALGDLDTALTSVPDYIAAQFGTPGNFFKSPEYQKAEQSATVMAEQYLRALTGAAAPEPEVVRTAKSILPQPGDGPEVIAQKRATRAQIIEALRIKAGPGVGQLTPRGAPVGTMGGQTDDDAPTATGPNGEKLILRNGQWEPM